MLLTLYIYGNTLLLVHCPTKWNSQDFASVSFLIKSQMPHAILQVDLKWTKEEVAPGSTVGLKVKAEPESLCGLRVVDKSVELLKPGEQFNVQQVFQALEPFQISEYQTPVQSNRIEYCLEKNGDHFNDYNFSRISASFLTAF